MFQVFKFVFILLRTIVFEDESEFNHKSPNFNTRKFIVFILLLTSIFLNGWIFYRFSSLAIEHLCFKKALGVESCKDLGQRASCGAIPKAH